MRTEKQLFNSKNMRSIFTAIIAFVALSLFSSNLSAQPKIDEGFSTPPDSVSLWCYYYWISDNVSEKGVSRDLEAMKKFGIGAALIGNIGQENVPYGKLKILTEPWWKATEHAIREGKRTGVDIGMFNCPGWSQSGGPWVKPTEAMRYLAVSEDTIVGPATISTKVKVPAHLFQLVAVLAFPEPANDNKRISQLQPKVTEVQSKEVLKSLIDENISTGYKFKPQQINSTCTIDFETDKQFAAQSIVLTPLENEFTTDCELYAKDSTGNFVLVKRFFFDRRNAMPGVGFEPYPPATFAFGKVESNHYRLTFVNIKPKDKKNAGFAEIELMAAPRVENIVEKQLAKMCQTPFPMWNEYQWTTQPESADRSMMVDPSKVIDLTSNMKDTVLTWNVPAGSWIIQTIGMTPTAARNDPSAPNATGYEVDKMNKKMLANHFEAYIGEVLRRMPVADRKAFKYVIGDSYEKGAQNWTDGLEVDFKSKYGYDPMKYLPVLTGRVIGSAAESDRFLWDLRRLVADRVAYDYVGGMREMCEKNNMTMWLENYGHWGFPGEFLQYGGQSQLVSGEFWNEGTLGNIECKAAVSAAHIYGKPRVSAEAFTAAGLTYQRHPAMLKKRGDWAFCEGINHFVLHLYIQQPDEREPGVNAWFSTEFNRHNTWFEQGKMYADYLRRCMFMLQQGKPVVDVAYFIGEDVPKMTGVRNPELPSGYSYDYINAEALMTRVKIENGRMVFPDGFSCGMLVLPDLKTMRPELLSKIKSLVDQGMVLYGPAPEKSPSLQNYPQCDINIKLMAAELWGDAINKKATKNSFGKGAVYNGLPLQKALIDAGIQPDVVLPEYTPVLWVHRSTPDAEIYFVTNQGDRTIQFPASFKVEGKQPEFWDAQTGEHRLLNQFMPNGKYTTVSLTLHEAESGFVVFRNTNRKANVYAMNFPESTLLQTISSQWSVTFDKQKRGPAGNIIFNALTDWSENGNDSIKYYSGTAVYTNKFTLNDIDETKKLLVDLGKVGVMATVKINGKTIGGVWITPYRLDISKAVVTGENTIEVEVVNVWNNRLVGDSKLPEKDRKTWIPVNPFTPSDKLTSSGLIGPVTIQSIQY